GVDEADQFGVESVVAGAEANRGGADSVERGTGHQTDEDAFGTGAAHLRRACPRANRRSQGDTRFPPLRGLGRNSLLFRLSFHPVIAGGSRLTTRRITPPFSASLWSAV